VETKIYPAGEPKKGEWVLQWRSESMPAPAFWYFESKAEAEAARERMKTGRGKND